MFRDAPHFDVRDYLRKEMMPHFLCPGCGHGMALRALLWALHELEIDRDKLAVVSGIGCAGGCRPISTPTPFTPPTAGRWPMRPGSLWRGRTCMSW